MKLNSPHYEGYTVDTVTVAGAGGRCGVTFCGCGTLATFYIIDKKKKF